MTQAIQNKYSTATNWYNTNPVLMSGEIGIESDTLKIKIGDGSTAWNSLGYFIASTSNAVGSVMAYATNSPPLGYVLCNGQAISRTTYSDLFSVVGTTFGVGDGSTTFNVPNMTNPSTGVYYMIRYLTPIDNNVNKRVDTFAMNFSISQKEDSENSIYDNQIRQLTQAYGSKFLTVDGSTAKLHRLDVLYTKADSPEITYTGSWTNEDIAQWMYGRAKLTTTAGDTAVFKFVGTGVALWALASTDLGYFTAEIAPITNGVIGTYGDIQTITMDADATVYNVEYQLYSGLDFGQYAVRITLKKTKMLISFFAYQTRMVQKSISQYEVYNASYATSISMVPPTTTYLDGTWSAINLNQSTSWNCTAMNTTSATASAEFKFLGKYIWVNLQFYTSNDVTLNITIDGGTTYVLSPTLNTDIPYGDLSCWVRLDNGLLDDAEHIVKISRSSGAGQYLNVLGWGWYTDRTDSTLGYDLILGSSVEIIGIDDARFATTGAGWSYADEAATLYRRGLQTTTNGDYATITINNDANIKAIYAVMEQRTDRGRVKITLGGTDTRYLNMDTNNYTLDDTIVLLYDSVVDRISLHNKQLKIEKIDGTWMTISGIIVEPWGNTKVGTNSIKVVQKWSRYNTATNLNTPVSNTYRYSVSGTGKTGQDIVPVVDSGWCYGAGNANMYFKLGVPISEMSTFDYVWSGSPSGANTGYSVVQRYEASGYGSVYSIPQNTIRKTNGSDATGYWFKVTAQLKRTL